MDSPISTFQILILASVISVIVLFSTFVILRFWPGVARVNIHSQALRVKELTARCDQLEGQNRLLLNKLVEASIENDKLRARISETEIKVATTKNELKIVRDQLEEQNLITPIVSNLTPVLVAVGSDAKLKVDYASLRGVEANTGMSFRRINDATLDKIKIHLDRARKARRPFDKMHLSVHSSPQGLELGGYLIDGQEFSEILRGIKILLIAGCESSQVGDNLSVVPFVITMTEKVSHEDAAIFTENFWTEIGKDQKPIDAFDIALEYSPPTMREYVERHW